MSEPVHQAVCAALTYLERMTCQGIGREDAQRQLRAVEAEHPEVSMQLLWEVEAYDGSLHYDVLVRPSDGSTVSISICRDRALPWPLRGIRRWSEANLVQVDGRVLTMEDAVLFLDVMWNEAPIMQRMIDACIIRDELTRSPILLDDDELQSGVDGLRRTHLLYTVEDTERWMRQRGMTHAQLEQLAIGNVTYARLRNRIAADGVASYFASHRDQFDVAHIARIECQDHDSASHLHTRVSKDGVSFASAMQEAIVSNDAPAQCTFSSVMRRDASSELEERLFEAQPHDVVGPLRVGSSYVLGCLLKLRPACDDAAAHMVIEQILFDQWLAERRLEASVTWYWGRAPAPGVSPP
jgi:putative peptide maturation system protein